MATRGMMPGIMLFLFLALGAPVLAFGQTCNLTDPGASHGWFIGIKSGHIVNYRIPLPAECRTHTDPGSHCTLTATFADGSGTATTRTSWFGLKTADPDTGSQTGHVRGTATQDLANFNSTHIDVTVERTCTTPVFPGDAGYAYPAGTASLADCSDSAINVHCPVQRAQVSGSPATVSYDIPLQAQPLSTLTRLTPAVRKTIRTHESALIDGVELFGEECRISPDTGCSQRILRTPDPAFRVTGQQGGGVKVRSTREGLFLFKVRGQKYDRSDTGTTILWNRERLVIVTVAEMGTPIVVPTVASGATEPAPVDHAPQPETPQPVSGGQGGDSGEGAGGQGAEPEPAATEPPAEPQPEVAGPVVERDTDLVGVALRAGGDFLKITDGQTASYQVVLEGPPTHDVTVAVEKDFGPPGLSASPASLVFTADNWDRPQRVTVSSPVDSDSLSGNGLFFHTVTSDDAWYDGLVPGDVRVRSTDHDNFGAGGAFRGWLARLPAQHGGGSFTVRLGFDAAPHDLTTGEIQSYVIAMQGGSIVGVQPVNNRAYTLTVRPDGNADVVMTLQPTGSCSSVSNVCTQLNGALQPLQIGYEAWIPGPLN